MASKHTTHTSTATVEDLRVATVLYDALMARIEPDLTTDSLKILAVLYEEEMPKEAEERLKRYKKALRLFVRMWPEFLAECTEALTGLRKDVYRAAKIGAGKKDQQALEDIEHSIMRDL